jgi:N6-adenosine-specific RNA methylase IME4
VSAKTKVKQLRRAEREVKLAKKITALPDQKNGVIVADPAWKYRNVWSEAGMDRSPENHYPCQELDAIKKLDVSSIAADDAVCFLWTTVAHEADGHEVLKAWGFKYVSQLVWVKNKISLGFWFRNKHEILLVGTKGNPVAPALGTQWESVLEAPAGEHSTKPEAVLEMIEAYYPTVPKIELNRRGPARPGWSAWGNEAEPEAETAEPVPAAADGDQPALNRLVWKGPGDCGDFYASTGVGMYAIKIKDGCIVVEYDHDLADDADADTRIVATITPSAKPGGKSAKARADIEKAKALAEVHWAADNTPELVPDAETTEESVQEAAE